MLQTELLSCFDGVKLQATWRHARPDPGAVALILPGSGNTGLSGDVSGPILGSSHDGRPAHLSEQLAETLAESGISSFRYAKRGFDDPSLLPEQNMSYLPKDAVSAFQRVQKDFPDKKKIVVGFSEGALLGLMVNQVLQADALFLLGLPTRPLDQLLAYQYLEWPLDLLQRTLDPRQTGAVSVEELLARLPEDRRMPLMPTPWERPAGKQALSIQEDLLPIYEGLHGYVMGLMSAPPLKQWYDSFGAIPTFADLAKDVYCPVYLYYGMEDAQVNWRCALADKSRFKTTPKTRILPGLGHCFSPMTGKLRENKTSGPFADPFLKTLRQDLRNEVGS